MATTKGGRETDSGIEIKPVYTADDTPDELELRGADPEVEHDLDLRLPHPRGGRDGGAGARVHPCERNRLLRSRRRRGTVAEHIRQAALVLLQRAQPLLPGGGEVSCRAPALGADHEGSLRCDESTCVRAALPCADRRLDAD